MSNQELKQIVEEFNQFVFSIDDSIKELKEIADSLQVDAVFDFSETSLGRIQVLVDKFKGGEVGDPDEKWNIINLVAKYLGEVFRKEVGGSWQLEKRKEVAGYGVPGIGKIPGLNPKYIWHPFNVVNNYWEKSEKDFFLRSISSIKDLL